MVNKKERLLSHFRLTLVAFDEADKELKSQRKKVNVLKAEIKSYQNAIRNGEVK